MTTLMQAQDRRAAELLAALAEPTPTRCMTSCVRWGPR